MSSDLERRLLARAHALDDTEDLAEEVTGILGGARAARLDPDAMAGLTAAALALGTDSLAVYRAEAARFATDSGLIDAVAEAEDELAARAAAVARLAEEAGAALGDAEDDLEAARAELAAARAMGVSRPCDGCHAARQAAIAAAEEHIAEARERIGLCESALGVLGPVRSRLRAALTRIRRVPADLGEVYETIYDHVRAGHVMPHDGDFLTGAAS